MNFAMEIRQKKITYTASDIDALIGLIEARVRSTNVSVKKSIMQKMRKQYGFYGREDWGIIDCQVTDLQDLIERGKIEVVNVSGLNSLKHATPIIRGKSRSMLPTIASNNLAANISEKGSFIHFDPKIHAISRIPNAPGNYIVCLRKNATMPSGLITPSLNKFREHDVIYTGISSKSLRERDYNQHFNGNAGKSTLRKSLGILFGYKQIPRDIDSNSAKTKFNEIDEQELSEWMGSNLTMYLLPTQDYRNFEHQLIGQFNPPLNLTSNTAIINAEFRRELKRLRANR